MKKILRLDWDLIAGIIAAVTALVLHTLHIVEQEVVLAVILLLLTLLLVRDLRGEHKSEKMLDLTEDIRNQVSRISSSLTPPDVILVGPQQLRSASEHFSAQARGDMVWFNVCLMMFKPQPLFDTMLKPAIENPLLSSLEFVIDPQQKHIWDEEVAPKINACVGKEKVRPPRWCQIHESLSFILSGAEKPEALLSFWGEPFMARTTGRDIPRYVFHVLSHSELVSRLSELERGYRLDRSEKDSS